MKASRSAIAILLILAITISPAVALFRFKWYHDAVESFAGNLSSGLDADERELWYANYDSASPDAQKINVFDAQTGEWKKSFSGGPGGIPVSSYRFIDIEGSKVLIGGPTGAALYDRDADEWKAFTEAEGLPSVDVFSGTIRGDEYWIGTNKGLGKVDSSGNWEYITEEDGLPNPKVLSIGFDGNIAWICTEGGILRFNLETKEKKVFTQQDGLPGDVARKVLIDGNNVWFAMKGGIGRIDKTTDEVTAYTTSSHKLISEEFKDAEILGDKIYFGGLGGVNYRDKDREGKWKKITTKNGLPKSPQRSGLGSDATHLAVQGDKLWIALWYEGIVEMSIPTGLAIIPIWVWIVAGSVAGIAALIIIRPGAEKGEVAEKERRIQERRKKAKTTKPPWELCGGVPQRQLCNRCKFNDLKAGKLFCSKYNIPIEYKK